MAYTTIDDPSAHFQTVTYSGNGSTQTLTNDGNSDLQPDLLWFDNRNDTQVSQVFDTSRGIANSLRSNDTDAENTDSPNDRLTAINSDGFSLGDDGNPNNGSNTYVCWQWKANGGTTSSNSDGTITSTVQANTTAGFSIVKYGDASSFSASSPATVGHGLGAVPKWILIKNLDGTRSWGVHHVSNGAGKIIYLDLTNAVASSTGFDNGTLPTSSVFTVNTLNVANGNNLEYIAYCFAEIQGYSKFSSYLGNANADGPFVYTGFKPAFVIIKNTADSADWTMWDTTRFPNNAQNVQLYPNLSNAEDSPSTSTVLDMLSNGFKIRGTNNKINGSSDTMIYMAFAEHPFVSSKGVPVTAR